MRAHTHTHSAAHAHTHTQKNNTHMGIQRHARAHTGRQFDTSSRSGRRALVHACETHARTHVLTAEPVGSMHNRQALNSYTN